MNWDRRLDLLAALLFVGLALAVIFFLIPVGVDAPRKVKFAALHPAYYPKIVGYCLLCIGVALVVTRLYAGRKEFSETDSDISAPQIFDQAPGDKSLAQRMILLAGVLGILLAYFLLLPTLGFVLLSVIVLLILMLVAGERQILTLSLVSVGVPAFLYFFFTEVANIPIPTGVLQPLLVG